MTTQTAPGLYPKVRRIRFPFGEPQPIKRHFADGGDIAHSHLLAFFSFIFPPGEEFFIRSVRRYSDQIADPVLKKRVAGFIGQEAVHGQQHRELNDKLVELGYRYRETIEKVGSAAKAGEQLLEAKYPFKRLRLLWLTALAATAAGEHYTAVLATRLFTRPEIQAMATDTEVFNLLHWHAYEELEHKSVAFDVYRAVGGPEWLRIAVMQVVSAAAVPMCALAIWFGVLTSDPYGRRHLLRVFKEGIALLRGPIAGGLRKEAKPYLRRGFHPDHIDTAPLLEEWSAKLFGDKGKLAGHLY
ncbi:metal-dependent hydrolase [Segniliparus rugosus]|uniref:Metal-dependent hydrolase n=1 Tax=Segniliparus rugosus (strain ATCC BAA-974 / DSM 45345 / CCUG 50838 / CIP 108380 / JCM 13579 / CDC 945) TaxID=679197 RepID=E5XSN7_SEGRC|nr:metal-dependent hydrolase [Segniliparus rugosus]EFV12647.1 hypothetical protein HMPREF9336_02509 [Segniliparus rugosus ATCC BAA-974]